MTPGELKKMLASKDEAVKRALMLLCGDEPDVDGAVMELAGWHCQDETIQDWLGRMDAATAGAYRTRAEPSVLGCGG